LHVEKAHHLAQTRRTGGDAKRDSSGLERDVVVRGTYRSRCRAVEVGRVGGHIGLGGEAVTAALLAGAVAAAEDLHRVGDDRSRLALARAVLGLPLAPVEATLDGDRAALGKVGRAVLALGAEDGDVEVVRLVDPLATAAVLAAGV